MDFSEECSGVFPETDSRQIEKAADLLRSGGVVAFPTETGYGLGASVFRETGRFNNKGLEKIYAIKQRPSHKPLLVLADSIDMLGMVSDHALEGVAALLVSKFWPGPLTLLFRSAPGLPWPLCGDTGKVGVRISSHPWATALVRAVGFPVTATSANLSGMDMALAPADVERQLVSPAPDMILDAGVISGGLPSTIVDCAMSPPVLVRRGMIDRTRLVMAGVECGQ